MSTRINPFADLATAPVFTPKPRATKPVQTAQIDRLAAEHNFPSRQAARVVEPVVRKRRVYKTGRNQQINLKATPATIERFYAMADSKGLPLCALLEQALDALEEKSGAASGKGAESRSGVGGVPGDLAD